MTIAQRRAAASAALRRKIRARVRASRPLRDRPKLRQAKVIPMTPAQCVEARYDFWHNRGEVVLWHQITPHRRAD